MTKWEEARRTAAEYNAKYDDFICAYGYEMTWSGGPGHTNTFNTYGTYSRMIRSLMLWLFANALLTQKVLYSQERSPFLLMSSSFSM